MNFFHTYPDVAIILSNLSLLPLKLPNRGDRYEFPS